MSVTLMAAVFDGDLPPVKRLVMLSLADHANDDGVCYPSISRLCKRTGLSERAVQKHLRELEVDGYLSRRMNEGKKGANLYHITPAPRAPRTTCTPAPRAPEPPHDVHPTPARRAPEPSRTISEPSVNRDAREIRELLTAWASAEAADSFIRYRRKIKKPLTVTAAKRLAKTLNDILSKGGDPDDALGLAEERGWQGLQSDWYFKPRGTSDRPQNRPDPALEQIARLAGLGKA